MKSSYSSKRVLSKKTNKLVLALLFVLLIFSIFQSSIFGSSILSTICILELVIAFNFNNQKENIEMSTIFFLLAVKDLLTYDLLGSSFLSFITSLLSIKLLNRNRIKSAGYSITKKDSNIEYLTLFSLFFCIAKMVISSIAGNMEIFYILKHMLIPTIIINICFVFFINGIYFFALGR